MNTTSQVIPFPGSIHKKRSFLQRWFKIEPKKTKQQAISSVSNRDTVLVVDDDPVTGILICSQIRKHGRHAILAKNGEEAWKILSTKTIHAVVSDYFMPEMDGIDLAHKMRKSLKISPNTALILLTACEDEKTFIDALYAGADMYLTKPVNAAKLDACLTACKRKYDVNNHTEQLMKIAKAA